jgi:hypothetical protein
LGTLAGISFSRARYVFDFDDLRGAQRRGRYSIADSDSLSDPDSYSNADSDPDSFSNTAPFSDVYP